MSRAIGDALGCARLVFGRWMVRAIATVAADVAVVATAEGPEDPVLSVAAGWHLGVGRVRESIGASSGCVFGPMKEWRADSPRLRWTGWSVPVAILCAD
ncbi:MAG: hypothetical protein CL908_12475 [Deltaproteobacteria bacterium]|nr:hypothetical protein [Deltaproteobacteria bacterium]